MIPMVNGEIVDVDIDKDGGFVARSALDEELIKEDAEGTLMRNTVVCSAISYFFDAHNSIVIDVDNESDDVEHINPPLPDLIIIS